MKIAVFHNLPPGGAKRVIYEEMKSLSKNHELHLFELESTDEIFLDIRPLVNKTLRYEFEIKSNLPSHFARLQKDYLNFVKLNDIHQKIARDINSGGYDVVLVHPDKLTQAPYLLKHLKIPSVYFCEELLRIAYEEKLAFKDNVAFPKKWYESLSRSIGKKIDLKNAKSASLILVSSEYIKKKVKGAYAREAVICRFGVDTNVFKPKYSKNSNTALFIGEKSKINGYYFAKSALNLIPPKSWPILKVISFSSGRRPRLTDEELAKEYSKANFTLCTSYNEPFGLVALEAMACETPVVAVNDGGYKETVVDGKTGFLLKRDPKEFAEKVLYLMKHPGIVKKMGEEGRKHVIKNFSWKKHADCLERYLQKVTN